MAVGTGLQPWHHGRHLAGTLRRQSKAGVLVACKESGAGAESQHQLPFSKGPNVLLVLRYRGSACPPLPKKKPPKTKIGQKVLLSPAAGFNSPSAAGGVPRGLPCAVPLVC